MVSRTMVCETEVGEGRLEGCGGAQHSYGAVIWGALCRLLRGWDAGLTGQKAVDVASLWPPESSVGSPCVPARAGTCR